jgi:mono/diheme cytochrome c family protein
VSLGKTLYMTNCAFCHGGALKGQKDWDGDYPSGGRPAMPLDGEGAIWRLSDRDLFDVTKFGGQPFSAADYKNDMPGFERQLSDADTGRQRCGNFSAAPEPVPVNNPIA